LRRSQPSTKLRPSSCNIAKSPSSSRRM
jgi:hypothetical protein